MRNRFFVFIPLLVLFASCQPVNRDKAPGQTAAVNNAKPALPDAQPETGQPVHAR